MELSNMEVESTNTNASLKNEKEIKSFPQSNENKTETSQIEQNVENNSTVSFKYASFSGMGDREEQQDTLLIYMPPIATVKKSKEIEQKPSSISPSRSKSKKQSEPNQHITSSTNIVEIRRNSIFRNKIKPDSEKKSSDVNPKVDENKEISVSKKKKKRRRTYYSTKSQRRKKDKKKLEKLHSIPPLETVDSIPENTSNNIPPPSNENLKEEINTNSNSNNKKEEEKTKEEIKRVVPIEEIPIIGVFDGHGPLGEIAACESQRLFSSLFIGQLPEPLEPENNKRKQIDSLHKGSPSSSPVPNKSVPVSLVQSKQPTSPDPVEISLHPTLRPVKRRFEEAFGALDSHILSLSVASKQEFGTTACLAAIVVEEKVRLLVANIGDSRAILGKMKNPKQLDSEYTAIRITSDHKLSREDEAARIGNVTSGIIVQRPSGLRVIPAGVSESIIIKKRLALNMSRSLGHNILGQCGVIPTPEFHSIEIDQGDLLVIGSDGLFEIMEDLEIISFITKYDDLQLASEHLATEIMNRNRNQHSSADNHSFVICKFCTV